MEVPRALPVGLHKSLTVKICGLRTMLKKVVRKAHIRDFREIEENLAYWLSKTPEERVAAVEYLRKQFDGSSARLQRSARVIQRSQS